MWQTMLFFKVCILTEKVIFIVTNVITGTTANICSLFPTDFASELCQELGIFQAIWCLYFCLLLSWIKMRNNISYVTRILYRLSCLVSSCLFLMKP